MKHRIYTSVLIHDKLSEENYITKLHFELSIYSRLLVVGSNPSGEWNS